MPMINWLLASLKHYAFELWSRLWHQNRSPPQQPSSTPQSSPTTNVSIPQGVEVVFEGNNPTVDIVAVHGLNGHRENTWTARTGSDEVNWLRDLLSIDLPAARVISWGYDANTHSSSRVSCQYLYNHAQSLVSDLHLLRATTNSMKRPIIFVAHSLGGIVVKSALIHSDASRHGALEQHRSVKISTHGIIFMGTPHQGGNNVQLGQLLTNIASIFVAANDRILQHLKRDSEWLQQQLGQYGPISSDFVTKFAFEEYETPTMLGHTMMVVPRASAVVPGQADAEPIVIHADHINMVKFSSENDEGYRTILGHLKLMVAEASEHIRSRWEMEARLEEVRKDTVPHIFSLPFNLSEVTEVARFIGRKEELAQLHCILDKAEERRIAAIHGLGGVGKTQLVIEYLKSYHTNYSATIWLNAKDETSLQQSFSRAAERILRQYPSIISIKTATDSQDPHEIIRTVKGWLDESQNNRWLVVFDNYDNPKLGDEDQNETREEILGSGSDEGSSSQMGIMALKGFDIRPFFPSNYQGAIIITTRSLTIGIGESIFLKKLTDVTDCLEILSSTSLRGNLENDKAAIKLTRHLGGLPLALATAGAYLNQVSTTWAEYLQLYEESWLRLQKKSPKLLPYENRAMYSTWNISYRQIDRKNHAAATLLRLWAYFDNDDLWYELLRYDRADAPSWLKEVIQDRISFDEVMRVLCDHGLVEADPATRECGVDSRGYSVHECVHSWMMHALNEKPDANMARLAMRCVASHLPDKDRANYWLVQQRLLLHADHCSSYTLKLVQQEDGEDEWIPGALGVLYADQHRLSEAEAMYNRALRGKEKAWGWGHTSLLDRVHRREILYADQRGLSEAEAMYKRKLGGKDKALFRPKQVSLLDTANDLGNVYADQGRLSEAEAMYNRALQGKEKAGGGVHTSLLDTVNNLGNVYADQGRLSEAEAMYKQVLQGDQEARRPEHISTLRTLNNLGNLYKVQGRLSEAEATYKRALQGKEQALRPEHTSTLITVNNLGHLYKVQGRLSEAEAMYKRALQGYEQALGLNVNHYPPALNTLEDLGDLFSQLDKVEQARYYYVRAQSGLEMVYGREDERYKRVSSRLPPE